MAFNAGSIEATLTLNRNPWRAGMQLAKKEAKDLEKSKFYINLTPRIEKDSLAKVKEQISSITSKIEIGLSLKAAELKAIKDKIQAVTGKIEVGLNLKAAELKSIKDRINAATGKIEVKLNLSAAELRAIKDRINAVTGRVQVKLNLLSTELAQIKDRINNTVGRISVKLSIETGELATLKDRINNTAGRIQVKLSIATGELQALQQRIKNVSVTVQVKLSIAAGQIGELRARLAALNLRVGIDLRISPGQLAELRARLRALSATVNVDINVRGVSALSGAGNQMRIIMALLPLLITTLGSAISAAAGLGGALVSAFGSASIAAGAFLGVAAGLVKPIIENMQAAQQNARTQATSGKQIETAIRNVQKVRESAADAEKNAMRSIEDAQRNLDRQVEDSAYAQKQALKRVEAARKDVVQAAADGARNIAAADRRVEDAERNLASAQARSKQAQLDLNRARKDAVDQLEHLKLSLRGAGLDEEQAMLDLTAAQEAYNQALKDGVKGDELKQLELNVRKAQLAVDQSKESYKDLSAEAADFAKTGIEGSDGVKNAQQNLIEAQQGVKDAERDATDASVAASQARMDAADQVAEAQGRVADAQDELARTQLESSRAIGDAERSLSTAREEYSKAQRDGAQQILEAQRQVKEQEDSSAMATGAHMNALTAMQKKVQTAIQGVIDTYQDLIKRTEVPVGNALISWLGAAKTAVGSMQPIVEAAAGAFQRMGDQADGYFKSAHWKNFVDFMARTAGPTLDKLWGIATKLARSVLDLIVAFQPLADWMLDSINSGLEDLNKWTGNLANDPQFQKWLKDVREDISAVVGFIGRFIEFLWKLSVAVAPVGDIVLTFFSGLLDGISAIDPNVLAAIGVGLASIMAALVLGAGGPVAIGVGVLLGLGAGLAALYRNSDAARASMDQMGNTIQDTVNPAIQKFSEGWTKYVIPAWDKLKEAWEKNFKPVFDLLRDQLEKRLGPALEEFAKVFTEKVLPAVLDFFTQTAPFWAWLAAGTGAVAIEALTAAIRILGGAFEIIGGVFKTFSGLFTGDWTKFWDGLHDIAEGFWTALAGLFGMNLPELKAQFQKWNEDLNSISTVKTGELKTGWEKFWQGYAQDSDGSQGSERTKWGKFLDDLNAIGDTKNGTIRSGWQKFWQGYAEDSDGSEGSERTKWGKFLDDLASIHTTKTGEIKTGWEKFWQGYSQDSDGSEGSERTKWGKFLDDLNSIHETRTGDVRTGWQKFWAGYSQDSTGAEGSERTKWGEFLDWVNQKNTDITGFVRTTWNDFNAWWQKTTTDAVEKLKTAWHAVGNAFRDPINWVINVVLNDGVLKAWNTVMGWIGQPALSANPIQNIPAFATGGEISGPGTGTDDKILARVSNGEYIVKESIASKVPHFLNALNSGQAEALQAAGSQNAGNPYPQFAAGGPVEAAQQWASSIHAPYTWGGVGPKGWDCSGFMSSITNHLRGKPLYQRVGTTANFPWQGFHPGLDTAFAIGSSPNYKGTGTGHMAGVLGGMNVESSSGKGPHTGAGARGPNDSGFTVKGSLGQVGGTFVDGGGGGGIVDQIVSWWSQISDKVTSLFNVIPKTPPTGGLVGEAAGKLATGLTDKAFEALKAKLNVLTTTISGTAGGIPGSKEVTQAVADVFSTPENWGPANQHQWVALSELINKESSWNPTAKNPTSTASGLFQFINGTWKGLGGSTPTAAGASVTEQARIGKKYIKQTYTDPVGAWNFHKQHNWYDEGGMLQPGQAPINMTKEAERVLSPQQTGDFEQLVSILSQLVANDGEALKSGGDVHVHITTTPHATAQDIIEAATYEARKTRRKGIYG